MILNFKNILKICFYSLFFVFTSCKHSETLETQHSVNIHLKGVESQGNQQLAPKVKSSFTNSSVVANKKISLNDNYYLDVSLVDQGKAPLTKTKTIDDLPNGSKYRVLVYDVETEKINAIYEFTHSRGRFNTIPDLEINKSYHFIIYSIGSTSYVPDIDQGMNLSTLKIKDVQGDLMVFKRTHKVVDGENNLFAVLEHKFNKINFTVDSRGSNKEITSIQSIFVGESYKSADYSIRSDITTYNRPLIDQRLEINRVDPYTYKGSCILIHPVTNKVSIDITNLMLTGGLNLTKKIDFEGHIIPGRVYNVNLKIKPKRAINELRILSIGSNSYVPEHGTRNAVTNFIESPYNFGSGDFATVKVNKIRIIKGQEVGITQGLGHALLQSRAHILIVGWAAPEIRPEGAISLADFIRQGGGVYYATQSGTVMRRILAGIKADVAVTASPATGTGLLKQLTNINHPVLNGPFGDITSLYLGDDADDSYAVNITNEFRRDYDVLSYSGNNMNRAFAFAHKKYRLVVVGDAGTMYGNDSGASDRTRRPFAVTPSPFYQPTSKAYGSSRLEKVYNSTFFANAMVWLIDGLPDEALID